MSQTVRDGRRSVPFVPAAAATAIVRARRDVVATADRLTLAIEILRHLGVADPVPALEQAVARLEEIGVDLRDVRFPMRLASLSPRPA
jgi:hypothetical protein